MKDYYDILGVSKGASQDDIKKAFRKKAHQYHPDKKTGDESKFKEINEAYQALGDSQKRKKYDQFGSNYDQYGGGSPGGFNWQDFAGGAGGAQQGVEFDLGDLGEMFGDMFGFGGRRGSSRGNSRGEDLQVELSLDFMEAVFGTPPGKEKVIEITRVGQCERCKGNKAEPGTKIKECSACEGKGRKVSARQTILGSFQSVTDCEICRGQGKVPEKPCTKCNGTGVFQKLDKISFKIPAGIDTNEVLRITGKGNMRAGGSAAGDLLVIIRVKSHKEFERRGYDIFSKHDISYPLAVLGGTISINTVDGEVALTIPPGTSSIQTFKLKGKGVPHLRGGRRGDHFAEVTVVIPKKVTARQKEILKEFAEISGENPDSKRFWSKLINN